MFSFALRMICELETNMTSSQRIYKYTQLESEDLLVKDTDSKMIKDGKLWPQYGQINFQNVTMRYREGLEPSIMNLNMNVQPKMKVGIVGRTGAGKSSIL